MITLLLITAMLLGGLAFFEPCTIATHALFAARSHQRKARACCHDLLLIWLTRCALLALLLGGATALTGPMSLSAPAAAIGLLTMASLYLISRWVYLPVPHLAFHRLIPGGGRLPAAMQLGLSLPACTLPLFVVTLALALTVDSVGLAALAGVLFGSLFTLPIAIAARQGIGEGGRRLLDTAARSAPYVTAGLFVLTAAVLIWPQFVTLLDGVTAASLKQTLQQASLAGLGVGLLAGFIFSFNPVSFAAIPVVLAYVTQAHDESRAFRLGAAFVVGMIATHVALGVAAALGGEWVKDVMGREWGLVLGPLLVLLGLMWPGWLKLRLPWLGFRARRVAGMPGAFLLGIPFSVAVCPFCAPALLIALTASAAIGSVSFGAALLLAFALGRSVPILLGAWAVGWLESLRALTRHQRAFEIIGGLVMILTGLYLLNEYLFIVPY